MGDSVEDSQESPERTYGEYLDELCAYFVSIGVPINEFWHGDHSNLKIYENAFRYRMDAENERMWIQGLYFYRAMASVVNGALGDKDAAYIDKPIDFNAKPESEYDKMIRTLKELEQRYKDGRP